MVVLVVIVAHNGMTLDNRIDLDHQLSYFSAPESTERPDRMEASEISPVTQVVVVN
jgi:hypothetical protein